MIVVLLILMLVVQNPEKLPKWTTQLQGSWVMKKNAYKIYEHWIASDDTLLSGSTYLVTEEADSVLIETIEIKYENDTLYYVPTIVDDMDNLPVYLKLTSANNQLIVFENPDNDFPHKIQYRFISPLQLKTSISGEYKGREYILDYDFKKVK